MGKIGSAVTTVIMLVLASASASAGPNEDAVMNADRAFNAMAQEKGVAAAFRDYAAPSAVTFARKPEPVRGPEAIFAHTQKDFGGGGKLVWEPKEATASNDGTLGTTWGRWTYTAPKDEKGQSLVIHGTYLTVWQKQADGSWKYTHDIGQSDLPPPPPNGH
ncbi:MAG: DUF4440 domain-containing protein [Alphaproteobacteria bacterium]|nr:DUF4440 domain-containing protein [Alphaproteobacteria bacterium]